MRPDPLRTRHGLAPGARAPRGTLAGVLAALLLAGPLAASAWAAAPAAVLDHYIPDRYIVVFHDSVARPRDAAQDLSRRHGLTPLYVYEHAIKLTFRRSGTRFLPPPLAGIPGSAVGEGRSGQAC